MPMMMTIGADKTKKKHKKYEKAKPSSSSSSLRDHCTYTELIIGFMFFNNMIIAHDNINFNSQSYFT